MFQKINKLPKSNNSTNKPSITQTCRIQQIDGGFFEKFGSLFHEQAEYKAQCDQEQQSKLAAKAAALENDDTISRASTETEEGSQTSDDSEEEIENRDEILSCALINIDELYSEILYEILHNVGCDVTYEIGQSALITYVQDVFKVPNAKHLQLLAEARQKEATEILLNVEVIEARDLSAKDSNGLSDPFVTLFVSSNPTHRYNTSVRPETLSPAWQEHFALPVAETVNEDHLHVEVWDFDPAESVREKLGKILHVKGLKGVRKLMKEITVAAATGQHENELIGTAKIPLNSIPAPGMTMWYGLSKKNKVNRQGTIKIRLSFSSEKKRQVAEQEHRQLMRRVLLHELETSQVAPFWWSGSYSPQGRALLEQHVAQSGLSMAEVAICRWSTYISVHLTHPLSFSLFGSLLEQLVKPLQTGGVSEENLDLFWNGALKLLPSCFATVRKVRKKNVSEKAIQKHIVEVLNILKQLNMLSVPNEFELFPKKLYPWVVEPSSSLETVTKEAVRKGCTDWFNHIIEKSQKPEENGSKSQLQYLLQVVQLVRIDVQKAIEFYDKLFQETINFQYARCVYSVHQSLLCQLAEPDIKEICTKLKRLSFSGSSINEDTSDELLTEGTILFEVYLGLFNFTELGKELCPNGFNKFEICDFHLWFHNGVARWLEIAFYKAQQRITKAVELDTLERISETEKYSSSAIDTLTIFYQVKVFWQQLNWPDVEGRYTFIAKIIDDISRSCIFYGERMELKLELLQKSDDKNKRFEVSEEWCLAINNIEYVKQSLQPFTDELGISEVVEKLSDLRSPMEAQRCQQTLTNVTRNAIDTIYNKIIDLLESVVLKMVPSMKRLLVEGAELFNQDNNSVDRLMLYVDTNLHSLHSQLNEENFNKTLEIVWNELGKILIEIIDSNVNKRRPPTFFENLHKTLNLMMGSFKSEENYTDCDKLKRIEWKLQLHSYETPELLHQVHLDLFDQFRNETKESPFGELRVRVKFEGLALSIEMINARNLMAMDSNGSCDAFVRIHLLPEHKFIGVVKSKTRTHYKNQFPLFDETFVINLTQSQRDEKNALILFSVKDKDLLGYNNQYIGEALVRFSDIVETNKPLSSASQTVLPLWRPTNAAFDSTKVLEQRQGDRMAKDFLKKFKQRMGS